ERPAPAAMTPQSLLGAEPVDRKLQRPRLARRGRQLVVDEPERAVLEQVEPVGDAMQADAPGTTRTRELEFTTKLLFEQALADGRRALGLHWEDDLAEARGNRRTEEPRALDRCLRVRKAVGGDPILHDLCEQRASPVEICRRDGTEAVVLPAPEERL